MRIRLGKPSPALVIACISLFVALGGVGYAAATGSIDGREIKNNSVASKDIKNSSIVSGDVKNSTLTGSDLKNNAVKGSNVDEGSLGKVGSASRADNAGQADSAGSANTANTANSAGSVGGLTLRKVAFLPNVPAANGPIASLAGLTINASCLANEVTLNATTSVENSAIFTAYSDTDTSGTGSSADLEQDTFDTTSTFDLMAGDGGNEGIVNFVYQGRDGRTVSGQLSTEEGETDPDCAVVGALIGG